MRRFIFRFGVDTLNYYEYRAPIRQGWDPLNEVVISFDELTAMKRRGIPTNVISHADPRARRPAGRRTTVSWAILH